MHNFWGYSVIMGWLFTKRDVYLVNYAIKFRYYYKENVFYMFILIIRIGFGGGQP